MKKTKKVRVVNPMQFHNAVMKIASEFGEDYGCAHIEVSTYLTSHKVSYKCYTPLGGWQQGETMSEALSNLRNAIEVKKATANPGQEKQNESFDDFPI